MGTLSLPNIAPIDYIPAIKSFSDRDNIYNVYEYSAPESIEEVLGLSQYYPRQKWWDSDAPLISLRQSREIAELPSVLIGDTVITAAEIVKILQGSDRGTITTSGILSALSGKNAIGYIASALGAKFAEKSGLTDSEFWEDLIKSVFGDDALAPDILYKSKNYIPKKMVGKVHEGLVKAKGKTKEEEPDLTTVPLTLTVKPTTQYPTFRVVHGSMAPLIQEAIAVFNANWGELPYYDNTTGSPYTDLTSALQFANNHPELDGYVSYIYNRSDMSLLYITLNFITEFGYSSTAYPTPIDQTLHVTKFIDGNYVFASYSSGGVNNYMITNYGSQWSLSQTAGTKYVEKKKLSTNLKQTFRTNVNDKTSTAVVIGTCDDLEPNSSRITRTRSSFNVISVSAYDTVDLSGVPDDYDSAVAEWADTAIGFPAKVGTDEKELWYPLTIPEAIPWVDGYTGTKEKAREGEITKDRTATKDEVIDNTLPDTITQTQAKTDVLPNPTPTPLPTIPSSVPTVDLGLTQLYNPTVAQLKSFSRWLWGTEFDLTQFKKLFGDPMQAIIGLHAIYATPVEGGASTIQLGYINSGVTSQVVKDMFTTINCGTVHIPESFGDVRDYNPYTSVDIYLPFIGMQQLNTDDIMGADVNVTYKVDVLTGACIALISVKSSKVNGILYSFTGNCSIQLPITSGNYIQAVSSLITGLAKTLAGAAGGGLAGGLAGAAAGAAGLDKTSVQISGGLVSNAGAMGVKKPYIIIRKPIGADATRYNEFYGYSTNKYVSLSQLRGFTRVKDLNLSVTGATQDEQNEIVTLLKEGVIL